MARDTHTMPPRGPHDPSMPANPIRCSFCGKEQGQVRKLVK